ncbi:diaminopimelate decarboxylase [Desulfofundulus thermosubterraneus DSM 16057]|uniref:Diaminopimelate decarboxylase n=1 Tax=Desulfofundulus thermosubterraneus DSM 16057 TaxID=1121432 RepID=A0A1M6HES4_9FIRM|nr:diaminopimelate decarboxylase [Desulfofundulus thermosubterraneus DSM 16057]
MRATRVPWWRNRVFGEAGEKGCPPKFSRCPERLGWAVIEQVPDCHPVVALLPGGALSHQGEGFFYMCIRRPLTREAVSFYAPGR